MSTVKPVVATFNQEKAFSVQLCRFIINSFTTAQHLYVAPTLPRYTPSPQPGQTAPCSRSLHTSCSVTCEVTSEQADSKLSFTTPVPTLALLCRRDVIKTSLYFSVSEMKWMWDLSIHLFCSARHCLHQSPPQSRLIVPWSARNTMWLWRTWSPVS